MSREQADEMLELMRRQEEREKAREARSKDLQGVGLLILVVALLFVVAIIFAIGRS